MGRRLELPWVGAASVSDAPNAAEADSTSDNQATTIDVPARSELTAIDGQSVAGATGQAVRQQLLRAWPAPHAFTFVTPSGETVTAAGHWQGLAALGLDEALGLPIQVSHVQPGHPAEEAGILAGDILVSVDGRDIRGKVSLLAAVQQAAMQDQPVPVVVLRDGSRKSPCKRSLVSIRF